MVRKAKKPKERQGIRYFVRYCPNCGSGFVRTEFVVTTDKSDGFKKIRVKCQMCRAVGRAWSTKEEAIDDWNQNDYKPEESQQPKLNLGE